MTAPFVSLDDLSDALGADVTADDNAVVAMDSACEQVRVYLQNIVNLTTDEVITLDGHGHRRLVLPQPPVREVSEVQIDGVVSDPDEYRVERYFLLRPRDIASSILILPTSPPWGWPMGYGNIQVTYTHGWDTTEPPDFERVPSAIRIVALKLAARIFSGMGEAAYATAGAVTSETLGRYQYRTDADAAAILARTQEHLLDTEMASLDPYRSQGFR